MRVLLLFALFAVTPAFALEGLVPPNMGLYSELGGQDLDSNGVRDDVDEFIQGSYTRSAELSAARQYARAVQSAVLAGSREPRMSRVISLQISRAVNCVYVSFAAETSKAKPGQVIEQVRSLTTNTKERLNSYLAFAKTQDDTAHELPRGATCV